MKKILQNPFFQFGGGTIAAVIIAILLVSVLKLHRSELMVERGKVIGKTYLPDNRSTSTGFGVGSKGPVITFHSTGEDESFNVVFQCEHGVIFTVNRKDVFTTISDQDSVYISYYELINKKGKRKDFEFVNAEPIK